MVFKFKITKDRGANRLCKTSTFLALQHIEELTTQEFLNTDKK